MKYIVETRWRDGRVTKTPQMELTEAFNSYCTKKESWECRSGAMTVEMIAQEYERVPRWDDHLYGKPALFHGAAPLPPVEKVDTTGLLERLRARFNEQLPEVSRSGSNLALFIEKYGKLPVTHLSEIELLKEGTRVSVMTLAGLCLEGLRNGVAREESEDCQYLLYLVGKGYISRRDMRRFSPNAMKTIFGET